VKSLTLFCGSPGILKSYQKFAGWKYREVRGENLNIKFAGGVELAVIAEGHKPMGVADVRQNKYLAAWGDREALDV
jgi:hypothetical protein